MHSDDEQTSPSFAPHYANEGLCFRDGGWGGAGRTGVVCLQEDLEQPGSHMLLINGLMDRQHSGLKSFHTNHYSLPNER